jgi:hypothetical protein
LIAFTNNIITICEYDLYRWPIQRALEDARDDARRWMVNDFPPPVEVALASSPLPLPEPPSCDLPKQSARRLVRVRGRRPLRGRSGRPHHEVNP